MTPSNIFKNIVPHFRDLSRIYLMLLILTVAGTVYAQDNSIVWTNIIVNSDLSGEDLSCFYSREYPGGIATPTVEDNVIVVNSPAMVDVQWESVFWVVIPQNLEDGTRVKVSLRWQLPLHCLYPDKG